MTKNGVCLGIGIQLLYNASIYFGSWSMRVTSNRSMTTMQAWCLVLMRIAIGWHFCFEGITKLMKGNWSSAGYLSASTGPFASVFAAIPENSTLLMIADQSTLLILTLGGLCLMLGLFTRTVCVLCAGLLALFYLAIPPLPLFGFSSFDQYSAELGSAFWAGVQQPGTEGNYFIVNKNVIEFLALLVIYSFDTGKLSGLDVWIRSKLIHK